MQQKTHQSFTAESLRELASRGRTLQPFEEAAIEANSRLKEAELQFLQRSQALSEIQRHLRRAWCYNVAVASSGRSRVQPPDLHCAGSATRCIKSSRSCCRGTSSQFTRAARSRLPRRAEANLPWAASPAEPSRPSAEGSCQGGGSWLLAMLLSVFLP